VLLQERFRREIPREEHVGVASHREKQFLRQQLRAPLVVPLQPVEKRVGFRQGIALMEGEPTSCLRG
jgi:hypothetical protein